MLQVANMIELGQIRAGLVVGTESSRQILETTIDALNGDLTLTRDSVKPAVASLTLGSASAAVLLTHRDLSQSQNRLLAAVAIANTEHHDLCRGGHDEAMSAAAGPLMRTDSEQLLVAGVATGAEAYSGLLDETGWASGAVDKVFTHQVGVAHRRAMLGAFGIEAARDFSTVEFLGNTGAAALPTTMALGIEAGHLATGDRLALLGIGSGINSVMLAIDWREAAVAGFDYAKAASNRTDAPSLSTAR
jgi:3-oxoacyl-[acyl-carrier-protein] synthase-3